MMTLTEYREAMEIPAEQKMQYEAMTYHQNGNQIIKTKCIATLEKQDDYAEEWYIRPVDKDICWQIMVVEKTWNSTVIHDYSGYSDGLYCFGKRIN